MAKPVSSKWWHTTQVSFPEEILTDPRVLQCRLSPFHFHSLNEESIVQKCPLLAPIFPLSSWYKFCWNGTSSVMTALWQGFNFPSRHFFQRPFRSYSSSHRLCHFFQCFLHISHLNLPEKCHTYQHTRSKKAGQYNQLSTVNDKPALILVATHVQRVITMPCF